MQVGIFEAPTTLARCIAMALAKDSPDIEKQQLREGMSWSDRKPSEMMDEFRARACTMVPSRPWESDIELVAMFRETWGSTALGFGGMGGSAMTEAYTTVLMVGMRYYLVYWGGRLGYAMDTWDARFNNKAFQADLAQHRTQSRRDIGQYLKGVKLDEA